jgi:hypothetical protein
VRVAVAGDQHPHGDEHDLEGQEEDDGILAQERCQGTELDQEQAPVERRERAAMRRVRPGVDHHRDTEGCRQQQ